MFCIDKLALTIQSVLFFFHGLNLSLDILFKDIEFFFEHVLQSLMYSSFNENFRSRYIAEDVLALWQKEA